MARGISASVHRSEETLDDTAAITREALAVHIGHSSTRAGIGGRGHLQRVGSRAIQGLVCRREVEDRSRHVLQGDHLYVGSAVATGIGHRPSTRDDIVREAIEWIECQHRTGTAVRNGHGGAVGLIQRQENLIGEGRDVPIGGSGITEDATLIECGTDDARTGDVADAHLDVVIALGSDHIGDRQSNLVSGHVHLNRTAQVEQVGRLVGEGELHAGSDGYTGRLEHTRECSQVVQAELHAEVSSHPHEREYAVSHHVGVGHGWCRIADISRIGHFTRIGRCSVIRTIQGHGRRDREGRCRRVLERDRPVMRGGVATGIGVHESTDHLILAGVEGDLVVAVGHLDGTGAGVIGRHAGRGNLITTLERQVCREP